MSRSYADADTVRTIRELAARVEMVRLTTSAYYDTLGDELTKTDVCNAICSWIDAGEPVEAKVTSQVAEHLGEPHYVMKPEISGSKFYVKVTILQPDEWNPSLLIISAHK